MTVDVQITQPRYNDSDYLHRLEQYMSDENKTEKPEWVTTTEAAEIMDIHIESVRRLCRNGTIDCQQFGITWMVSRADAEAYNKDTRKGGRPYEGNNKNL